jgi:hypothetical protein
MTNSNEKSGKFARKAADFAVHIPNNVLSHMLVRDDTTIRVFLLSCNALSASTQILTPGTSCASWQADLGAYACNTL